MRCKALAKNERFTKYRRRDLIKMWRTLKDESGYRDTVGFAGTDCVSLRTLMDRMEDRNEALRRRR